MNEEKSEEPKSQKNVWVWNLNSKKGKISGIKKNVPNEENLKICE